MIKEAHRFIMPPDHNAIYKEQLKHLYRLCSISIVATLVNSFLLIFALRKVISHTALINWVTAMLLVALFQYILQQIYESSGSRRDEQYRWGTLFHIGAAMSGLFWGSTAIFLFPSESIIHQLFLALLSCGMLAIAVGAYAVILDAFLAYCIPAIIPIIIRFLVIGDEIHLTVGGMVLIFSLLMLFAAKGVNSSMKTYLEPRQTPLKPMSPSEEGKGVSDDRDTKLNGEFAAGKESEEERETPRTAQWMAGFDQLKKRLRENNAEEVKREIPGIGAPGVDRLPSEPPFLKDIARDFSNLFTYLQGKVSLALMDLASDQPSYDKVKDVERTIKKGTELTKRLLKVGIDPSKGRHKIDLKELIKKYAEAFGREKKQIAFHLRVQDRIWNVKADLEQVDRVIRSIYDDSCRNLYGGGDLYIRVQNVTLGKTFVAPHGLKPGKFVKVSITSISSGMDEGALGVSREESPEVRDLIKKNGGILNVHEEEGSETTLDLYLPANENGFKK
jgi:hypothetical protein